MQNEILSARSFKKQSEYALKTSEENSARLLSLASDMEAQGYTPESFRHHQHWLAEQQVRETEHIAYYAEAEKTATLEYERAQKTLSEPVIERLLLPAAEVTAAAEKCDGLLAVWLQYWQVDADKQHN